MRQLLLDLTTEKPQTLDTFVVGQNEELVQLLCRLERRAATTLSERFVYLWGASGAGKTHALRALASSPSARYISAADVIDGVAAGATDAALDAFLPVPGVTLYLIDDCDRLSAAAQIAAFNLFNSVREQGGALLASGAVAPAILAVREDLRTRLGWGLIYQIHELTDDEKIAALTHAAHARGLTLSAGVLPYLITHFRRDMRSLSAMLDALDQYSLEIKRPITLPLLRSLLLTGLEGEPQA